jgi:hypothetical protein
MGDWRKLRDEEFRNLYFSPSIFRMIKSKRTRWAGYIARTGVKMNAYRLFVGNPQPLLHR